MLVSTSRSSLRDVLKTSLPAVLDLSSQTIIWLVEAIFIGHISTQALAGVGVALQIIILTFTVVLTFVVGASIIIVRYLGNNDTWNANHVFAQALIIGGILSIFISLLWYFGGTQLFTIIREKQPIARQYGVDYLKTISYFGPLIILNFIALGIMRMAGDTLLSMKINVFANLFHISLSYVLIFGHWGFPRLEARGAALAASIAHSMAFVITLISLRRRKSSLFLPFSEFRSINFQTFKKLFKLGAPTTVEQLVWAIGQLVLSVYAARMGILALATHQVLVRVQSVLTMAWTGFGMASMTLVGKSIGASAEQRAISSAVVTARVALVFSILVAALLIFFRESWLGIFTNDPAVVRFGASTILVFALIQIPKAVNIVFTGNLRGGAELAWLMWLAISSVLLFEVLGAYLVSLVFGAGLMGLWLIQGVDESARFVLNYRRFMQRRWQKNRVEL
ncbi:MAG: MATE family efflux transporter [Calditrichaeota bacterium]|nr:MAG: MATE family efflux transporter [Calditrichota bacterium]